MKVYIVYKFLEYNTLFPHIEAFVNDNSKDQIFYFKPQNEGEHTDWKEIAEKKIAESNAVVYVREKPLNNYNDEELGNIKLEIEYAQNHQKNIVIVDIPSGKSTKTGDSKEIPDIIFEKNFSDKNCIKYKVIDCLNMKDIKAAVFDMEETLFSKSNMEADAFSCLLLEEYKIMLDTSEKMMDRRQGTNNFYISLCTAMLTVIVAFIATKTNTYAWSVVTLVISGMMMYICYNWKKTLESYGLSNQAKYEVLNTIEEKLPASIFASEWEYGKIIDYTSYSKRESNIPETFKYLFGFIVLAMMIVFGLTWFGIIPEYLFH